MSPLELATILHYPGPWLEHGLLSTELVSLQAAEFVREYGSSIPSGGTEHWRYGAFLFWLRRELDTQKLEHLLEAAIADPDPPMVGNVIKDIAKHRCCTQDMLRTAVACVSKSEYYYVSPAELQRLFERPSSDL